jgi:hypothetical protein
MQYETIQINDPKKPGDYLLINARDFDPKKHTKFGEAPAQPTEQAETPKPKAAGRRTR